MCIRDRTTADRTHSAYIRPKLHQFVLSPYVLQSWLYNIIVNKSIKWSLSIIVQICDNNRTFCYRPSLVACIGNYIIGGPCSMVDFYRATLCCGICRRRVSVHLSVCVSVTFWYCIKTAKRRITQIMPHDRVFK